MKRHLIFHERGWEEYLYWQKSDKKLLKKLNTIFKELQRHPYEGIGKPEPLKHDLAGYWSRRLNDEHRIVYRVNDESVIVLQCRYHY